MHCILRTKKLKDNQKVTAAAEHNFRTRLQNNIDQNRTPLNQILVNTLNVDVTDAPDLQKKLNEYYQSLGIKIKSDNVMMMEFISAASPEFFEGKTKAEIDEWARHQVDFMQKEFGTNLKIAVLHLDERSPHLHYHVSTEIESVKQYKNRYGICEKKCFSLNAKRFNPKFLVGLQDRYAVTNERFGLKRGARRSYQRHITMKEFYSTINDAFGADYEKSIDRLVEKVEVPVFERTNENIQLAIKKEIKPMLDMMIKQQKVLKEYVKKSYSQLQKELNKRYELLEEEKKQVAEDKKHYGQGLKIRLQLENTIAKQNEKIKLLEEENQLQKQKLETIETQKKRLFDEKRHLRFFD